MKRKNLFLFLLGGCAFLLTACGGGGGSSEDTSESIVFSGTVEDGPLAGAIVSLQNRETGETLKVCGASGVGRCETLTNDSGAFFLRVHRSALSLPLEFSTAGGFDKETGIDFSGIPLRAPAELFRGREGAVAVTPVTSLVAARMRAGADVHQAADVVRAQLGLSPGADLGVSPSADAEIQIAALTLTGLALPLAEEETDPFVVLGLGLIPESPIASRPEFLSLKEEIRTGPGSSHDNFNRALLAREVRRSLVELLPEEDLPAPSADQSIDRNILALVDKIVQASAGVVVPLRGNAPQLIVRYVITTYGLTEPGVFLSPPEDLSLLLASLEHDSRISQLAKIRSRYNTETFLVKHEMPGDDDELRRRYFYDSDISPFYLAERMVAMIADDLVSAPTLVEIVKGKAEAGLLDEARLLIETQISRKNSEYQSKAYYELADREIGFGRFAEATSDLQNAELHLDRVMAVKGGALSNSDVTFCQRIGSSFRRAGDREGALRIMDKLRTLVPVNPTVNLYGNILVGTWKIADEYLEAGDLDAARPLVEFMEEFARETPPNVTSTKTTFAGKVFYLMETARRYEALGQPDKVLELYRLVQSIRTNDGYQNLTASATWAHMDDFIELLFEIGRSDEAYALADQMPASYAAAVGKLLATYAALNDGMDSAMAVIQQRLPSVADQIDALTYFAENQQQPYIALSLIESGRMEEARVALDAATVLLSEMPPQSTESKQYTQGIRRGYVKLADLYRMSGDIDRTVELLETAGTVVAGMSGLQSRVDGRIDILLVYREIGMESRVEELLSAASIELQGAALDVTAAPDLVVLAGRLIDTCFDLNRREWVPALNEFLIAAAGEVFDAHRSYTGDDHDKMAKKEVDGLIAAADYSRLMGDKETARNILMAAAQTAGEIFVEAASLEKLVGPDAPNIIGSLAMATGTDEALELARQILFGRERNLAYRAIADAYAMRDDFPGFSVASIDTDHDGLPDFFHPFATAEEILRSGLLLDSDCDGDGIQDAQDRRPLYRDGVV